MQNQENVTQTGAGIAEPLQNKEKQEDNWGGTGAGSSKTGAGIPTQDEAVTATTITSDTGLGETEKDNSYSLLQIEKDDQDVTDYVGRQVEVREGNRSFKFAGKIVSCDVKNGIASVMTEQGKRDAAFRETFIVD